MNNEREFNEVKTTNIIQDRKEKIFWKLCRRLCAKFSLRFHTDWPGLLCFCAVSRVCFYSITTIKIGFIPKKGYYLSD